MELFLVRRVRVPPCITGERYTGPIMVCKMIYVNTDYTVGSRPSYIDPVPDQSLGYLTPSIEAMIKTTHRCHPRVSPTYAHAHKQILQESPPEYGSKSAIPRCKNCPDVSSCCPKATSINNNVDHPKTPSPDPNCSTGQPFGSENLGSGAISHAGKPPTRS